MEGEGFHNGIDTLLNEYEDMINVLTEQVDSYKKEHYILKTEINTLIIENGKLTENILQLTAPHESERNIKTTYSDDEFVANLKQQLQYAIQEKECVSDLWQNSLRTIDQLEEELQLFEGRSHGYVPKETVDKLKGQYENQLKNLQLELLNSQKSLQSMLQMSRATINAKSVDLEEALKDQKGLFGNVHKLENELRKLQGQQKEINDLKDILEKKLKEKDDTIERYEKHMVDSKVRILEAVSIVEAALNEKDGALLREKDAKEEVSKISKMLSSVVEETEEKVQNEVQLVKTKFDIKLSKYQMEIESKDEDLKAKSLEIETLKKECKLLDDQVNRLQKGNINLDESNISKLLMLEKNLEATFQKLLTSEKKLLQMTSERDSLQENIDQMAKHYEYDIKNRELEKISLQRKIKQLQDELEQSNFSLIQFAQNVQNINEKIYDMDKDIRVQFELKHNNSQQMLTEKMDELKQIVQIQHDLKMKLVQQADLNIKWKSEFCDITEKLETRLKEIKLEANNLKKINKNLSKKLHETELKAIEYKSHLERLCLDVNKVADNTTD